MYYSFSFFGRDLLLPKSDMKKNLMIHITLILIGTAIMLGQSVNNDLGDMAGLIVAYLVFIFLAFIRPAFESHGLRARYKSLSEKSPGISQFVYFSTAFQVFTLLFLLFKFLKA